MHLSDPFHSLSAVILPKESGQDFVTFNACELSAALCSQFYHLVIYIFLKYFSTEISVQRVERFVCRTYAAFSSFSSPF